MVSFGHNVVENCSVQATFGSVIQATKITKNVVDRPETPLTLTPSQESKPPPFHLNKDTVESGVARRIGQYIFVSVLTLSS